MDDRISSDDIKRVQMLLPEAQVFADYASEDKLEDVLLRSRDSWEELVSEALQFPERWRWALERLNGRISKLQTQGKEAEATLKALGKRHPIPGTSDFADCEHEGQVAQLMLTAIEEPLQKLQGTKDSLPAVGLVLEGVAAVLRVGLPHVGEGVRQTISIAASRIRAAVILIEGQMKQYEELVAKAEEETGRHLECPTFNRQLLDQLKVEELVEMGP